MTAARYPLLFQLNTRVRLAELTAALGHPATLDDLGEEELDRLAGDGFDLFHLGQREGRRVRIRPNLGREPALRNGRWHLLDAAPT